MDIKTLGKILGFSLVVFGGWGGTALADEIPDYYSEAGFNVNRDYPNQLESEYIDPFSGTLNLHYTDLFIPGNGGMDLKIQRSYSNIHDAQTAALGRRSTTGLGWSIHFGRVSKSDADFCSRLFLTDVLDNPVLELPDGSKQIMADAMTTNKSYLYITQNRWKANCKNYSNSSGTVSGLEVWSPDGSKYDMAWLHTGIDYAELYPTRITDRNGNFIDIQYETVPSSGVTLITGVTTSDGRNVSFSYADRTNNRVRLTSISANGQTWTYNYRKVNGVSGDHYYLSSVTRPDGLRWAYHYKDTPGAGQYSISKVSYPYGGSMSYTYGYNAFGPAGDTLQTTSVSRKTGSGGAWTYRYTPGYSSDTTVISAPDATYTYKHFGARAANAGTLWKVGLLLEKRTGNVQTETYTWDSQTLSHENYRRPKRVLGLAWDNGYFAPVLTRKSITRDGTHYTTSYSGHDEYGNPTSINESGNDTRNTALTYDIKTDKWLLNLVSLEVISGVGTISRSYDASGNLTRQNKFGSTESYTYTSQGDISSYTDPGNKQTRYSNYKRGVAQTESQPEGVSISRSVNNTGTIASVTNGRTTSYRYDKMNRLSAISYPANAGVTISHSASGRTVSRGGYRQVVSYDGFGRPTRYATTGGDSITVNIRYDAVGRKTFESYPSSSSGITYTSDALGRVKSENHSGGGAKSFSYGSGNTVAVNDLRGLSTTYTYRSYGNPDEKHLVNIRSPGGISTRIDRNKLGLISSVSQGGKTRTYGYNSRFHLTSIRNPETGTTTYGRDNAGNMTSKRVGSSGATYYTYDGQHRMTNINYPAGTPDVAISYSTRNKITSVNNGIARRVFDHDGNDNITRETLSIDGKTFSIDYDISSLDHVSSITYPSGRRLSLSPNALGRPTQVGSYISSVSYFANGQPQSIRYGNGLTTTLGQNSRQWVSSMATNGTGWGLDLRYSYDNNGNVTAITDSRNGAYNRSMSYDGINRLTSARGIWGAGSFTYDARGNLTRMSLGGKSIAYNYDANNRLARTTGGITNTFKYDAYGNVTGNGVNDFSYNDASNLTDVSGFTTAALQYDGGNIRVSQTKNGVKTYFLYAHSGDLLGEYAADGTWLREYVYLSNKLVSTIENAPDTPPTLVVPDIDFDGAYDISWGAATGRLTGYQLEEAQQADFSDARQVYKGNALSTTLAGRAEGNYFYRLRACYTDVCSDYKVAAAPVAVMAPGSTRTTLSVSPNPATINQQATLTATVSGINPTGTVTFKDGASTLGTAVLNAGQAGFTATFSSSGQRNLTAEYGGDGNNNASSSSVTVLMVKAATTTTTRLSVTPNPAAVDQQVTLTVNVTGNSPSGQITFKNGSETLGTATLASGRATLTTTFSTVGSNNLTASYAGDAANEPSTSAVVPLTIQRERTTTTTLSAKPDPVPATESVTLMARVAGKNPTGTMTFKNGTTTLGTVTMATGQATFTTSFVSVGNYSLTAVYSGDADNLASTSTAVILNVVAKRAKTTTIWTTPVQSNQRIGIGQQLRVKVSPAAGGRLPCDSTKGCVVGSYGKVQFLEGDTVLGVVDLKTAYDEIRFNWAPKTSGTKILTARYLGTVPNAPSEVKATVKVAAAAATTTSWVTPPSENQRIGIGQQLRVKVSPAAGGRLPCDSTKGCVVGSYGKVQFLEGDTVLGVVDLKTAYDEIRFNWVPKTTGTKILTARYLGTVPNAPSEVKATVEVTSAVAAANDPYFSPHTHQLLAVNQISNTEFIQRNQFLFSKWTGVANEN